MKAYCFKCRQKRDMKDTVEVTLRNGQPMIRGVCSVCGTRVLKVDTKGQDRALNATTERLKKAITESE